MSHEERIRNRFLRGKSHESARYKSNGRNEIFQKLYYHCVLNFFIDHQESNKIEDVPNKLLITYIDIYFYFFIFNLI